MKKFSSLAITAILACGMAVPAMAQGANATTNTNVGTYNGTTNAATMDRTFTAPNRTEGPIDRMFTAPNRMDGFGGANDRIGTRNVPNRNGNGVNNGANAYGTNGFRATNTVRANAADDGMDWGWLGLLGLIGLAGLRNRERADR